MKALYASILGLLVVNCGMEPVGTRLNVFRGIEVKESNADKFSTYSLTSLVFLPSGCSGVIIDWRRVLTAKHCFGRYREVGGKKVFAGSHDPNVVRYVSLGSKPHSSNVRIGVVPGSVRLHKSSDLAFFDLSQSVPAPFKPIPVWGKDLPLVAGNKFIVLGFGVKKGESSSAQWTPILRGGIMRFTGKPIESYTYPTGDTYNNLLKLESTLTGQGACPGDSGGAVINYSFGSWGLVGITSGGTCDKSLPAQSSLMSDIRDEAIRQWFFP